MADTQETAAQRITNIINDLQMRIFEDMKKIEAIAQEEQGRYDEGSKEAMRWHAFGGEGAISDTFTAERSMNWQLSALLGQMALRQLNRDKDVEP